ncbi:MAG: sigma-70 family RNA polymerase sigma factor [Planctomycetales bacterium]|nr:sigma-70 family RNA polymerase sigma factor [Planctomycetales bacterium]MCA9167243.1 sigma-70 family RNA polymerase sigma factor [Planctomycetales bacterium]
MNAAMPNSSNYDTDALVQLAASGDMRAVQHLMDRHRNQLRRMVDVRLDRRIAPRVDPSDIVQETLLTAHQRLNEYLTTQAVPYYVWLRQLATSRLIDLHRHHLRAQRRSVAREHQWSPTSVSDESALSIVNQLPAAEFSPSELVLRKELLRRVRQAMEQLSTTDREVLIMRHLEELSVRQVAEILDISEGTVKSRHFRALSKLQRLLGNE